MKTAYGALPRDRGVTAGVAPYLLNTRTAVWAIGVSDCGNSLKHLLPPRSGAVIPLHPNRNFRTHSTGDCVQTERSRPLDIPVSDL